MLIQVDQLLHGLALTVTVAASMGWLNAAAHGETASAARCSMGILPGARDSLNTMLLLGRATRDTIEAGGGVVDPSVWRSDRVIYGQLVRVDSMLGPGANVVRQSLHVRQSTEVLIVPWANNPGCGIDVWRRRSAKWTTPDSSGLFSVRLRPESVWVAGRPTFDAFFAGNYSYADGPYTVGPHFVFKGPTGATVEGPSMTPAEVFALYAALSTVTQPTDSLAIARLRAWVRANPSVLTRYPGNHILVGWQLDPPR